MEFHIVVLFLATLAVVHAGPGFTEEQKAKYKENVNACKESTKATDEEITKLKNGEVPEDAKCFTNCLLEKFGLVKDGAIQEAKILESFTVFLGAEKAKQIVDLCKGETGANKCETSYKLHKCFHVNKAFDQ